MARAAAPMFKGLRVETSTTRKFSDSVLGGKAQFYGTRGVSLIFPPQCAKFFT
jgi:hypothetical protein